MQHNLLVFLFRLTKCPCWISSILGNFCASAFLLICLILPIMQGLNCHFFPFNIPPSFSLHYFWLLFCMRCSKSLLCSFENSYTFPVTSWNLQIYLLFAGHKFQAMLRATVLTKFSLVLEVYNIPSCPRNISISMINFRTLSKLSTRKLKALQIISAFEYEVVFRGPS